MAEDARPYLPQYAIFAVHQPCHVVGYSRLASPSALPIERVMFDRFRRNDCLSRLFYGCYLLQDVRPFSQKLCPGARAMFQYAISSPVLSAQSEHTWTWNACIIFPVTHVATFTLFSGPCRGSIYTASDQCPTFPAKHVRPTVASKSRYTPKYV